MKNVLAVTALILSLPALLSISGLPAAADPVPGVGGLKPGCGYVPKRLQSCYRKAKAGPDSGLVCRPGNLTADPWLVSSQLTGRPYSIYPDFSKAKVARAGRLRYGLSNPRPPGFWPLGGFDGPWAEGFWTGKAALQFFWDNPSLRPPSLRLGSPAEWDGQCSQREQFDLSAFGGRWIITEWQRVRDGGPPPAPQVRARFRISPPNPKAGQDLVFDARASTGPVASFKWDLGDGTTKTGRLVRHSFPNAGRYSVFLEVETSGCTAETCRDVSSQVLTVRAAGGPPPPPPPTGGDSRDCGPHPTCIFLVRDGKWTRFVPDTSSTGRMTLEVFPSDPLRAPSPSGQR